MEKSKIPTVKFEVGTTEKFEVEAYKWLTQEEDDRYNDILMGNKEFEFDVEANKDNEKSSTPKTTMSISMSKLADSRKFLIETMCVNLKWEDFNVLQQPVREEIQQKLEAVRTPGKK